MFLMRFVLYIILLAWVIAWSIYVLGDGVVAVVHDEWTKYGRVLYKDKNYELVPSHYTLGPNGRACIDGVLSNED